MKKLLTTGLGTVFLTEEMVRKALKDLKLPKEVWTLISENAIKTKQDLIHQFAKELSQVLEKVLSQKKIRISLEIQFEDKEKVRK